MIYFSPCETCPKDDYRNAPTAPGCRGHDVPPVAQGGLSFNFQLSLLDENGTLKKDVADLKAKLAAAERREADTAERLGQACFTLQRTEEELEAAEKRASDAEERERRLLRAVVEYIDHCSCVCDACAIHTEASNAADASDRALNKS